MIDKVVIAAAGRGTRMKHLSEDKPKHLIKVCGHPFLYYLLNNFLKAGYKEIVLVVGYKKKKMKEFLDGFEGKDKVTLVSQFDHLDKNNYGTACVVKALKEKMENESFVMVYGDNLYSVNDLKRFRKTGGEFNYVAGLHHEHPEKYGVLKKKDKLLKKIIEKPKKDLGKLVNVGLYSFTPEIFKKVDKIKKSERGEYEITDAINLLAEENKVKIKKINDFWLDFGNPSDVEKVSSFLKNKKLKIQKR